MCGELAGDPAGTVPLLGMDVDSLSTAAAAQPRAEWVVRSIARSRAIELLEQARMLSDADSVRRLVHHALEEAGLGGLVRAGR